MVLEWEHTYNGSAVVINRLSRLMGDRRMSIQDVVRGTGLSYKTVWDIYHDNTQRFDRDTINRLCTFFGVDTQQLLEWQPDKEGA